MKITETSEQLPCKWKTITVSEHLLLPPWTEGRRVGAGRGEERRAGVRTGRLKEWRVERELEREKAEAQQKKKKMKNTVEENRRAGTRQTGKKKKGALI